MVHLLKSHAKWLAVEEEPPMPMMKTLLCLSQASNKRSMAFWMSLTEILCVTSPMDLKKLVMKRVSSVAVSFLTIVFIFSLL